VKVDGSTLHCNDGTALQHALPNALVACKIERGVLPALRRVAHAAARRLALRGSPLGASERPSLARLNRVSAGQVW
jgi:hypothetical protein